MAETRVLIVAERSDLANELERALEDAGYSVAAVASTWLEAVEQSAKAQPNLVLMDINLSGELDSLEAGEEIRTLFDLPVLYLAEQDDDRAKEKARKSAAAGQVVRSLRAKDLCGTIERALYKHQLDRELTDNEAWFRAILESTRDAIFIKSRSLVYTQTNRAMERLLGLASEELVGKTDQDLFGEELGAQIAQADGRVLRGEVVEEEEALPVRGQHRTLHIVKVPMRDPQGKITGLCGIARDITARKESEETLRRRNRELALINRIGLAFNSSLDQDQVLITVLEEVRSLLRAAASSIWLRDPATDEVVCRQSTGPQSDVVLGWRLALGEGIVGWVAQHGQSLVVPDALIDERHFGGVDAETGLQLRSILSVPLQIKHNVIGVIQVMDTGVDRFQPSDLALVESLASAAAVAIENARLYKEADRLRAFNENIVQGMQEGILLEDDRGYITFLNPKACDLLGYSPEQLIGHHWSTVVSPDSIGQVEHESHKRSQGTASSYEATLLTRDGRRFPAIISARPMFEEDGFTGVLSAFTDISKRVRAEKEREQLISELQEALAEVKTLSGLLPICSSCNKIRDDQGYWHRVEVYLREHSDAEFSHGLCPDCARKLYPDFFEHHE